MVTFWECNTFDKLTKITFHSQNSNSFLETTLIFYGLNLCYFFLNISWNIFTVKAFSFVKTYYFLLNYFLPQVFPTSCLYSPTAKWKTSQIYRKFVSDSQILFRSADNVLVCVCVWALTYEHMWIVLSCAPRRKIISSHLIHSNSLICKQKTLHILVVFV